MVIETAMNCLYVPSANYAFVKQTVLDYSTGYYTSTDGDLMVNCSD